MLETRIAATGLGVIPPCSSRRLFPCQIAMQLSGPDAANDKDSRSCQRRKGRKMTITILINVGTTIKIRMTYDPAKGLRNEQDRETARFM